MPARKSRWILTFPPSYRLPSPAPNTNTLFSPRFLHNVAGQRRLGSNSTASSGPTGTLPPCSALRHHRFLGCQARRSLGRPCAAGEGAASASPKGSSRSSAPCNGVRQLFSRQGPTRVPGRALPGSEVNKRRSRAAQHSTASLPIPGVPQPPPAPAVCPPPFCAEPLRHRYNSRPGSRRKGSGPPRYGPPPSNPLLPTGQRSYLCLPD